MTSKPTISKPTTSMQCARVAGCALALVFAIHPTLYSTALADDYLDELEMADTQRQIGSPERFALELRIGPYKPDTGNDAANDLFADDSGLLLGLELDVFAYHIPYVGPIGLGFGFGWADYEGEALATSGGNSGEQTHLTVFPLSAMAVLRIDTLARHLHIPFVFAGKLGIDAFVWDSDTGERDDANNISYGLRWSAQVALELDFLQPSSARRLDEEWGINHSFLFFEIFGNNADSTLPLAPQDGFAWTAGLGLIL